MMDRCKTLMNKAFDSSEEMRRVLHAQDDSGRTLVKFVRGNKIIKEVVDPNALATEILVGGWVELNIDPSDPCLSESKTPDKTEILSVQSDTLTEETSRHSFFEEFPDAADGYCYYQNVDNSISQTRHCYLFWHTAYLVFFHS
jgi:hypothetical protein